MTPPLTKTTRKLIYAGIAALILAFDVITGRDILHGKTDAAEGVVMLLGSLVILFLLYRKFNNVNKS